MTLLFKLFQYPIHCLVLSRFITVRQTLSSIAVLLSVHILLAASAGESFAQQDSISAFRNLYWLSFAYGSCNIDDELPILLGGAVTADLDHNVLTARIVYGSGQQANKLPHEQIFDVGLLYGYSIDGQLWHLNASVGLGFTYAVKRIFDHQDSGAVSPIDIYRSESKQSIGLPWQIQVFSKFSESSKFGLGLELLGDINAYRSFVGFMFTLLVIPGRRQ